ncbi:MAG: hypothetical protein D6732_11860 [Methanobacteriota archaeon]|nr:MAG: hypothetical protein D6732_11860 [Euryarchaeota archaeon]
MLLFFSIILLEGDKIMVFSEKLDDRHFIITSTNLLDSVEQLCKLISDGKKNEIQKTILIHKHINNIDHYFNEFANLDTPVQSKIPIYKKCLDLINEIEYNLPNWLSQLDEYKIHQIRLMFISALLSYHGQKGILMFQGLAISLSNILLGIKKIKIEDLLVEKNHPEYIQRLAITFNLLYENFLIYSKISSNLREVDIGESINWLEISISNMSELIKLLKLRWDVKEIFRRGNGLHNFGFVFNTFNKIIDIMILIYSKFREAIPKKKLSVENIMIDSDLNFIKLIRHLRDTLAQMIEELIEADQKGVFGFNNRISEEKSITESLIAYEQIKWLPEFYQVLYDYFFTDSFEFSRIDKLIHQVEETLVPYYECHNDPKVVVSEYGESSLNYMFRILYLYALKANLTGSPKPLDRIKYLMGAFLTPLGLNHYPLLYYHYLYFKLKLAIDLNNQDMAVNVAQEILNNLDNLELYPRDKLSFTLLGNFVLLAQKQISLKDYYNVSLESFGELIHSCSNVALLQDIANYLEHIHKILINERTELNFTRLNQINIFDPFSAFPINLTIQSNEMWVIYLPFNLLNDGVII